VDEETIISEYSLEQAIEDGVLVEVFKNRWQHLSSGKPIVATAHLFNELNVASLFEIWNEFVDWKKRVEPTLPEEERLFCYQHERCKSLGDRGYPSNHAHVSGGLLVSLFTGESQPLTSNRQAMPEIGGDATWKKRYLLTTSSA
jgi:hypothetical protein